MDEAPPSNVSPEQIQELRDAFRAQDPHDTGKINTRQLGNVLRALGQLPTEAELYDLVDEIDEEGEGDIKFAEFEAMMIKRLEALNKDESLQAAFKLFDRDDDGYISQAELKTLMFNMGERCTTEEFSDMMREIDTDNDGKISYAEFVYAMRH